MTTAPRPAQTDVTPPRSPRLADCMRSIKEPELYKNFAVHLLVMFPAAMVMAWIGSRLDRVLGVPPLGEHWPVILGVISIVSGGLWVWYVYGYLFLSGQGSPGSHVDGGPTWLVDTGPYAMVRHPSVLGKLAGVIGVGLLWRSPVFLVFFVPTLLVYSLLTNRYLQERYCDARFSSSYARYREVVPMLLPTPAGIRRWRSGAPVVGGARAHGPSPRGAFLELRWYLLGLATLIATFTVIFLAMAHLAT